MQQYPLYDRSGVEDDDDALPIFGSVRAAARQQATGEIRVCHAGTCLARGAEAVLAEIEELVTVVGGGCAVRETGCLGYCNQAPNAVVIERGSRRADPSNVHIRIRSLEASAKVVERATGRRPALQGAGPRLAGLRTARARQRAIALSKWNAALHGLAAEAAMQPTLKHELGSLLKSAGFPEGAEVGAPMPSAIENYSLWSLESVTPVTKHSAILRLTSKNLKRGTPHPRTRHREGRTRHPHREGRTRHPHREGRTRHPHRVPRHVPLSIWVTQALLEPRCRVAAGGRGRLLEPITWHTTLLAAVGTNDEGPLPWIERDYTPVSSAKEWEQGRCELLVKVYPDGAATSWLHRSPPSQLFLSKPERTLHVPSLVAEGRGFRPASVLLLLAGTGVVALPQVLAHRDPPRQLAISTPRRDQLHVPIDLVFSCREDDVLLLPQIAQWCREGDGARGLRTCTLLLTPPVCVDALPFPDTLAGDAAEAESLLHNLANARVLRARLSADVLAESLGRMPQPCRVVVSGPGEFNTACRTMLEELMAAQQVEEQVTILSA